MATSLREAIMKLEKKNLVLRIKDPTSPMFEVAFISQKFEKTRAIIFENIENFPTFQIVSGIYGDRKRLSIVLDIENGKQIYEKLLYAVKNPVPPKKVNAKYDTIIRGQNVNLYKLPIPRFYEKDKGPYITSGIIIAKDTETGARNASYHRMTPIDRDKLVVRIVERDLWAFLRKAEENNIELEAAVVIGVDPATAIAAATSLPLYKDELEVANSLLGNKLSVTKGETVNVEYPSNAEIVLEGKFILNKREKEGPFTDITGTYDSVRMQPVFKVSAVLMRKNPIFHSILPAGTEHKTLMGLPRETKIYEFTRQVSVIHDVYLAGWGCGWLECVISISKRHEDEPIDVGLAAFAAHPSLKKVILVDPDINIRNCSDVYWAVLTRAHSVRDYIIIPRGKGSSLDHSGTPCAKIIIDATIKKQKELFEKSTIPATKRALQIIRKLGIDDSHEPN